MKKKVITFLLLQILFVWNLHAQSGNEEVVHSRRIYKTVDTLELMAHVFYKPSALEKKGKTGLAFFHGGGWAFGKPEEFFGACKRYASMGFVAVSFQYRLVPEKGPKSATDNTPIDCVVDARSALRWLREHAEELGVDPDKIVAGGQSVGGQLAWATAMFEEHNDPRDNLATSAKPNAVISWSGTVNTVTPWCDFMLGKERDKIWSISPIHHLKAGLPPAIAFHGTKDEQVDFWTVAFFARDTKALGNYFELHKYEGRTHYLGKPDPKYATLFDDDILLTTDDFLKKFGFIE